MLAASTQNFIQRVRHFRCPDIQFAAAERHTQVIRSDERHIEAIETQDGIEMLHRAFGLDLCAGDSPIVGLRKIIAVYQILAAERSPASHTARRVLYSLYQAFRIVRCRDKRANDALSPCIEGAANQAHIVVRNANQGR